MILPYDQAQHRADAIGPAPLPLACCVPSQGIRVEEATHTIAEAATGRAAELESKRRRPQLKLIRAARQERARGITARVPIQRRGRRHRSWW